MQNVVAIDGPSGAGKSSMARALAKKLEILYVDTGAMYRALGVYFHHQGFSLEDESGIAEKLSHIGFEYGCSADCLVKVNGEDLTQQIREHTASDYASRISKLEKVREYLVAFQRTLSDTRTCVVEGRDIGTVVFPQAFCKIYFTASVEVRAQRRFQQLSDKGESGLDIDKVKADIEDRDKRDMERENSPLKQASDAILFDTSDMTKDLVLDNLEKLVREKALQAQLKIG
ncbi:MAG: (d)CMP kinase [Bacteriovoracaceae bacterium]|nr:(d)CMP kinase [Bacteriovoracaceae bacterium]